MALSVNTDLLKIQLRLPEDCDADTETQLQACLNTAIEHVVSIRGASFDDVSETDRELAAIKFYAAWLYEHPAEAQTAEIDGLQRVMDALLSGSRRYTYPV